MLINRAWTMFGLGCLGLWLIPCVCATEEQAPVPVTISLREIRHAIDQRRANLRTLQVEGYLTSQGRQSGQWVTQRLRVTFAAAGDQRYLDVIHVIDNAGEELDEYRNQIYLRGNEVQVFFPLQRRCERLHGANVRVHDAHFVHAPFFLECLGWWPPGDETPPSRRAGQPIFLHEAFAATAYRLRDEPEPVEGVQCLVVENLNVEKLWFDPEKNFSLRRREWYAGPDVLSVRYDLSEYKEVMPGIWFPRMLRRIVYEERRVPHGTMPPVERETIGQLDRVIVNQVSEELFRFHPPAGTLVWDRDSDEKWQTPGGLSWLDEVIQVANARNSRRAVLAASSSRRAVRRDMEAYVLVAVVLLLTALDVCLLYRAFRKARRNYTASLPATDNCLHEPGG
jgi:hypothetical protein